MTNRMFAVALAVALAVPAAAQTSGESGTLGERAARAAGQPPAPAQGQPGAQQGQHQLTDPQRAALGEVWSRNRLAIQLGDMAATRGASNEVKNLGRVLAQDHRREEKELSWLVGQRGGDVNKLAAGGDRQRLEGEVAQLNSKSGEEFDREFVGYMTRNNAAYVDALKRARDVTPGKDSALKKWLDDSENTEEGHLTAARQLKSQRQARTPPAR